MVTQTRSYTITNSFIFLNRISYKREKSIWQQSIYNWDSFLNEEKIKGISKINKLKYDSHIKDAKRALNYDKVDFFNKWLPKREVWRLYDWLREDAIYLDIETDMFGKLNVISLSNGEEVKTFVRGLNLDFYLIRRILNSSKMVVTFNGSSFDIPILKHYIKFKDDIVHFDLRPAFIRLGYNTGLKRIERIFHIKRDYEVMDFSGIDALELWKCFHKEGNRDCLKLLVEYNRFDAINLKPLAEIAYEKLRKKVFNSKKIS